MSKASPEYNLKVCNPNISKECDYEENHPLKPEDVAPHSDEKVWWICEKQHSYDSMINHRTRAKGCRKCYLEDRK